MQFFDTEAEQVAAIKAWWKEYAPWLLGGLVLAAVLNSGWQYWQNRQHNHAEAASLSFQQVLHVVNSTDPKVRSTLHKTALHTQQTYADTPYGSLAALFLAQDAVKQGKLPQAEDYLRKVLLNKDDNTLQQIARLRLARIQLARGHSSDALKTLDKIDAPQYLPVIAMLRGDAYYYQGKKKLARQAYAQALRSKQLSPRNALHGAAFMKYHATFPLTAKRPSANKASSPKAASASASTRQAKSSPKIPTATPKTAASTKAAQPVNRSNTTTASNRSAATLKS